MDFDAKRAAWEESVLPLLWGELAGSPDWESFDFTARTRSASGGSITYLKGVPVSLKAARGPVGRLAGSLFLYLPLSGALEVSQEGTTVVAHRGDCIVLDPMRLTRTQATPLTHALVVEIDRSRLDADWVANLRCAPGWLQHGSAAGSIAANLMERCWRDPTAMCEHALSNMALSILQMMCEAAACRGPVTGSATTHRLAMVRRAKEIVLARVSEPGFGPSELALAMGVTRRYLSRLFEADALSPGEYIWKIRLDAARILLIDQSDRLPISEIARRTGFSSPCYFTKMIVSAFGASPVKLRQAASRS